MQREVLQRQREEKAAIRDCKPYFRRARELKKERMAPAAMARSTDQHVEKAGAKRKREAMACSADQHVERAGAKRKRVVKAGF